MNDKNKNNEKKDKGVSTAAKVALGAGVIGAGILSAKALSKEENRNKIKETAENTFNMIRDEFNVMKGRIQQFIDSNPTSNELKSKFENMKNDVEQTKNQKGEELKKSTKKLKKDWDELSEEYKRASTNTK